MINWDKLRDDVEETAVARKKEKVLTNEADYFAGAMAAIASLTGEKPNAYWTICILTGRSIVKERMKRGNPNDHTRAKAGQAERTTAYSQ